MVDCCMKSKMLGQSSSIVAVVFLQQHHSCLIFHSAFTYSRKGRTCASCNVLHRSAAVLYRLEPFCCVISVSLYLYCILRGFYLYKYLVQVLVREMFIFLFQYIHWGRVCPYFFTFAPKSY